MFIFAMKSPVTRRKYTGRFVRFLNFTGLSPNVNNSKDRLNILFMWF